MKGESKTVKEAKELVNSILAEIQDFQRRWQEQNLNVTHYFTYKDDWGGKIFQLLGHDIIRIHNYNAAREFGCNEIEARYYALKQS